MPQRIGAGWFAFLAMCFVLVGLTGVFATFAAPLPLQREARREQALDRVLQAGLPPDAAALRDDLGDSAALVLDGKGDLAQRVAEARAAARRTFALEAAATRQRLLLLIGVVTVLATAFGAFVLQAAR